MWRSKCNRTSRSTSTSFCRRSPLKLTAIMFTPLHGRKGNKIRSLPPPTNLMHKYNKWHPHRHHLPQISSILTIIVSVVRRRPFAGSTFKKGDLPSSLVFSLLRLNSINTFEITWHWIVGLSEELPKPQKVCEHQVQLLPSINCIFIIVTKRTNQISQQDSQQVATNSTNNKGDKHPDQPKSVFDLIKRRPYHFLFFIFIFIFFQRHKKHANR